MTKELHFSAAAVGWALAFSNGLTFLFSFLWGTLANSIGRCWAMITPATIGIVVAPLYLLTTHYTTIALAFSIQGAFAGAIYAINPSYANERFPTENPAAGGNAIIRLAFLVARPFETRSGRDRSDGSLTRRR
jgi:MFS family permease